MKSQEKEVVGVKSILKQAKEENQSLFDDI